MGLSLKMEKYLSPGIELREDQVPRMYVSAFLEV